MGIHKFNLNGTVVKFTESQLVDLILKNIQCEYDHRKQTERVVKQLSRERQKRGKHVA